MSTNRTTVLGGGGGVFSINTGTTLTYNGQISGNGQLTKNGSGTMILTNALNNYTGGTLVLNGILQTDLHSLPGDVQVNAGGFLNFQQNADGIFTGVITGAGNVIKSGDGKIILTALQTYNGNTDIEKGALQATTQMLSNTNIIIRTGAALFFNQNTDGVYNGQLSNGGSLVKMGTGTVRLGQTNTYTGGTFINDGSLSIAQDSFLGEANGTLTISGATLQTTANVNMNRLTALGINGATFLVDHLTTLTQNGKMTGAGDLIKNGDGSLVLNNASNNYTGTTIVNAGLLKSGAAGSLHNQGAYIVNGGTLDLNTFDLTMSSFSGLGGVVNLVNAHLTLDLANNSDYYGAFTGLADALISKTGAGIFYLHGDQSAFLGKFKVLAGELIADGIFGGTMEVGSNSRLKGSGTLGNTTVAGTIAPGNSIGTLTINGQYVQMPGSVYELEINPSGASDLINVSGIAYINGGDVHVMKESGLFIPGTRFTILTAGGGVMGTYDNLIQDLPYLQLVLAYDANDVFLNIQRNSKRFSAFAISPNEIATANALDSLSPDHTLNLAIANLPDIATARTAFNNLSGELHASLLSSLIDNTHYLRDAVLNQLSNNTLKPEGTYYWTQAFDSWNAYNNQANVGRFNGQNRGLFIGADHSVNHLGRLGIVAGSGRSTDNLNARDSNSTSDNLYLGAYMLNQWDRFAVRSAANWAFHDIDTQRTITVPEILGSQKANYRAHSAQIFTELAYTLVDKIYKLEPIVQLIDVRVAKNSFNEQGSDITALQSSTMTQNVFYSTLGLRADTLLADDQKRQYHLRGLLGWRHAYSNLEPLATLAFEGGSSPFFISGVAAGKNTLLIDAGINVQLYNQKLNLDIAYNGQLASIAQDHGVQGRLSYRF